MVYAYKLEDNPEEKRKLLKELIDLKVNKIKEITEELVKLRLEYWELIK